MLIGVISEYNNSYCNIYRATNSTNKKGVTFWVTPNYNIMLRVFLLDYFTSSKSTSVTSSLPLPGSRVYR